MFIRKQQVHFKLWLIIYINAKQTTQQKLKLYNKNNIYLFISCFICKHMGPKTAGTRSQPQTVQDLYGFTGRPRLPAFCLWINQTWSGPLVSKVRPSAADYRKLNLKTVLFIHIFVEPGNPSQSFSAQLINSCLNVCHLLDERIPLLCLLPHCPPPSVSHPDEKLETTTVTAVRHVPSLSNKSLSCVTRCAGVIPAPAKTHTCCLRQSWKEL